MHLARKKVLLGLIDEVDPPHVTDIFPKDGFHEDLTDLPHAKILGRPSCKSGGQSKHFRS